MTNYVWDGPEELLEVDGVGDILVAYSLAAPWPCSPLSRTRHRARRFTISSTRSVRAGNSRISPRALQPPTYTIPSATNWSQV